MKDDDPEKRIRELERELADTTRGAQSAPYTENPSYTTSPPRGGFGTPTYGYGAPQPRRRAGMPWYTVVMLVVMVLSILTGVAAVVRAMVQSNGPTRIRSGSPYGGGLTTTSSGPTAVPQGGELRVNDDDQTRTIACNDGKLTFTGYGSKYIVTGHCVSLLVGGYNNNVTVDSADTLESTGYNNTITDKACNNAAVKLSAYGIAFNATGHCTSIGMSSYDNKVTVDSVDTITVAGYNNNVTYHSGTPRVTDSGFDNSIRQG